VTMKASVPWMLYMHKNKARPRIPSKDERQKGDKFFNSCNILRLQKEWTHNILSYHVSWMTTNQHPGLSLIWLALERGTKGENTSKALPRVCSLAVSFLWHLTPPQRFALHTLQQLHAEHHSCAYRATIYQPQVCKFFALSNPPD
jgi:hypothetical protein